MKLNLMSSVVLVCLICQSQENSILDAQINLRSLQTVACNVKCQTCIPSQTVSEASEFGMYLCLTCPLSNPRPNLYIRSCQAQETTNTLFLTLAIVAILLHFFMLFLGYGVYSNIFNNIQTVVLVSWGYGAQSGISELQALNFAKFENNSFLESFATQFFIVLAVQGLFCLLVASVDRLPHNAIATLVKRKKIIFPIRLESLFFNMSVFTAAAELFTLSDETEIDYLSFIMAIIAVVKAILWLTMIFVLTNFKNFQIDDPRYYVIVEKFTTRRWYVRNYLCISMVVRMLILVFFVALFKHPEISGLICTGLSLMLVVFGVFSFHRYIKCRFQVFNQLGNAFTTFSFFFMYGCGSNVPGGDTWESYKEGYYIMIICLISTFFVACVIEIISNGAQILKQIKSIFERFIICRKMDDQVELNKYDRDRDREKVTSFRKNLIYNQNIELQQTNESQFNGWANSDAQANDFNRNH